MKRTITYYVKNDTTPTININDYINNHIKTITTHTGDEFIEALAGFYKRNESDAIIQIKEQNEIYGLREYVNDIMKGNLYRKMLKEHFGKDI